LDRPTAGPIAKLFAKLPQRNKKKSLLRILRSDFFSGGPHTAFFAAGTNFPDALSASAAAGGIGGPVILVRGGATTLDAATRSLITTLGVSSAKIAGGTGVVTSQFESSLRSFLGAVNVKRLAGADRYATSSAINRGSFTSAPTVYFAAGTGFADALGGAALAGRDHAPLYVVPSTCVPAYIVSDLQALGTTHRVLLGGTGVLSAGVANLTPCPVSPAPAPKPAPTKVPANPGDTKNCGDFSTWRAAQDWFNYYYPYYGDIAGLDKDSDRIACESLPGHP
jgi:hypothetical protein